LQGYLQEYLQDIQYLQGTRELSVAAVPTLHRVVSRK
jgi:hypothetical protein